MSWKTSFLPGCLWLLRDVLWWPSWRCLMVSSTPAAITRTWVTKTVPWIQTRARDAQHRRRPKRRGPCGVSQVCVRQQVSSLATVRERPPVPPAQPITARQHLRQPMSSQLLCLSAASRLPCWLTCPPAGGVLWTGSAPAPMERRPRGKKQLGTIDPMTAAEPGLPVLRPMRGRERRPNLDIRPNCPADPGLSAPSPGRSPRASGGSSPSPEPAWRLPLWTDGVPVALRPTFTGEPGPPPLLLHGAQVSPGPGTPGAPRTRG